MVTRNYPTLVWLKTCRRFLEKQQEPSVGLLGTFRLKFIVEMTIKRISKIIILKRNSTNIQILKMKANYAS